MERLLGSRARKSEQSSTSAQAQQRTPTPTQHTHTKNISTLTAKEEKANAVQRHPHQARPDHVRHAAWQQTRVEADGVPAAIGPTWHGQRQWRHPSVHKLCELDQEHSFQI